jgi:hypothetical protein
LNSQPSDHTWVSFAADGDEHALCHILDANPGARVNLYRIDHVTRVTGQPAFNLASGWPMVRIESGAPLLPGPTHPSGPPAPAVVLQGVTQNLHYTSTAQRQELERRSRPELRPAPDTQAVLIPIRKSPDWWRLAQDQRQAHFQSNGAQPGHTAMGLEYVDRVYRKLYHSRYLATPLPYDFLTYFEFALPDQTDFKQLLNSLRDPSRNPEWQYTDLEFEIWMIKVS